jgi:hypothetical protein
MPHHRNRRIGRDGGIRAEPGASASARLARRQTGYGGCGSALLAWERGAVACMTYSNCANVYVYLLFRFLLGILPAFVLTGLHFSVAGLLFSDSKWK